MKAKRLPLGKLDPGFLNRSVLSRLPPAGRGVLVGPGIGEDSAILDPGEGCGELMVVSSDPISGAELNMGRYAVHVNANDVATSGARPRFFLTNILLRRSASGSDLESISKQIVDECQCLGVSIVGGHTEVSPIERTIVSSTMIGFVPRQRLARRPVAAGDRILLTKGAGIEGTSILASEMGGALSSLEPGLLRRGMGYSSMISVIPEAMVAAEEGVRRMHDPTEGGVIGGLRELAQSQDLYLRVFRERVSVREETRAICGELGVDPLKLISSGSLLCIFSPGAVNRVMTRLDGEGIASGVIGQVEGKGEAGLVIESGGEEEVIDDYPTDELWRILS